MFLDKLRGRKPFYLRVLAIALPLMLQQLVSAGIGMFNNIMVGNIITGGEKGLALAGVATVNRMYNIALFVMAGMTAACSIFTAQFIGAGNPEGTRQSYRFSLLANTVVTLPFVLLALLFPRQLLSFFTSEVGVIELGTIYLKLLSFSLLPLTITLATNDAMRASGDVHTPMLVSIVCFLLNGLLSYLFIFGHWGLPQLGVFGAALAILLSRTLEMLIILLSAVFGDYSFKTKISALFKIDKALAKAISIKALPLVINEFFWTSGFTTLLKFYATRGTEVMVAYAISQTVSDLFFILFGGMATATLIIVSQKLGANKLQEAKEDAYQILNFSLGIALLFSALMFASSFIVPNLYAVSGEAKSIAQSFIWIQSFMFCLFMGSAECYFILRAGGDTLNTLLMDSVFMWAVNIVVVGGLTYFTDFNIIQIYICGQATDILKLAVAYYLVKKGKWIRNLTDNKEFSDEY